MTRTGPTARIGVVFALREEEQGLARVLQESRGGRRRQNGLSQWSIGRLKVVTVRAGMGRRNAQRAAVELISDGAQWIISAGLAAGLDPTVHVGDVVIGTRVVTLANGDTPLHCSDAITRAAPPSGKFGFVIRHGDIATMDAIVCESAEKTRVYNATGAVALDMESYAVAEVARRAGVPFAAIRSISDTAWQDLPDAVPRLAATPSAFGQALIALSNPSLWLPLSRLRGQARRASNSLGEVIGLLLLRLM